MVKANQAVLLVFTTLILAGLSCGTKIEKATPSITINLPSSGSTLKVGETIEIVSTASGEAGIAQVELSIDGQVVNIATPPRGNPTTFAAIQTWRPDAEGEVRVTVVAHDVDGKESEPASIELVVVSKVEATVTPSQTSPIPSTETPTKTPFATHTKTPYESDNPTPTKTPYVTPTYITSPEAQIQRTSNQIAIAPGDIGHAVVACPVGSIVTSGGFSANPDVLIYTHSKSGNGWQAYGVNNAASEKLLTVYATCLSNTDGSSSQIYDQVVAPAGGIGNGAATCPAGSVVTGGGWASNSDGSLAIYNSSKSGNGWQVYARNTSGEEKFFNAYAICLAGTNGITNQRGDKMSITAGSTGAVGAVCDDGALVTGGGFAANKDLYIYDTSLEKGSDSTWWAYAINPTGSSQLLGSYATCITFP